VSITEIDGAMHIGSSNVFGAMGTVRAINPATNTEMEPAFGMAGETEVLRACALAEQAFDTYRATSEAQRAVFLETIAEGIMALGVALIDRAALETGLLRSRLESERERTVNQLRLFAKVLRAGRYLCATLDTALPQRLPPRPDLRLRKIAIGPVAVFGASNFPLAFSVAGGDTASALAAGCPVIVKAHGAHLGTSELVANALRQAVIACGLPEGVFSTLIGSGSIIGQQLVSNPVIKAVGFTGSRSGGLALMRTAAARPEPIPVYAEMSSTNPVFLLPGALEKSDAVAQAFVDSLVLGSGQFCTNPGLILGLASPGLTQFTDAAVRIVQAKVGTTMLTPGIHQAFNAGVAQLAALNGVTVLATGQPGTTACSAQPNLARCSARTFLATSALREEIFGPSALLISCDDISEMHTIAESLEGQLTATVHASASDHALAAQLLPILERKAGRILFNAFPTGVEVSYAMVHGGPFPATSDSRSTSVGASAIDRFIRPVCYQNVPDSLLPACLSSANPANTPRLVDGDHLE